MKVGYRWIHGITEDASLKRGSLVIGDMRTREPDGWLAFGSHPPFRSTRLLHAWPWASATPH